MKLFLTCYGIVLKAMVGGGLIFFPITFNKYGILPSFIAMGISIFFMTAGWYNYIIVNHYTGPGSMDSLSRNVSKYLVHLSNISFFSNSLLSSLGYVSLIEQGYIYLFDYFGSKMKHTSIIMGAHISIFVLTLSCLPTVNSLGFTSILGVLSAIYIVVLCLFRFIFNLGNLKYGVNLMGKKDYSIFMRLPILVFSFYSHQTPIPIQNENFKKKPKYFLIISISTALSALLLYSTLGITMNYLYDFNEFTLNDSCLLALPKDKFSCAAIIFYIALLTFSIPLQLIPLKLFVIDKYGDWLKKFKINIHLLLSFCFNFPVCLLYFGGLQVEMAQMISGGIASTFLALFLPNFLLIWTSYGDKKINHFGKLKTISYISLLFGTIVFVAVVWKTIIEISN